MNWKQILHSTLNSDKVQQMKLFIKNERKTKNIYPDPKNTLRAFELCPYEKTKVVILGQDPYHSPGTADGLAFSTMQNKIPPALKVIFKEIYRDLNIQQMHNITIQEYFPVGNLEKWAKNGFLLLNTALTVEQGKPGSHKNIGWELIIETTIDALLKKQKPVIFLLWGNDAKQYIPKIKSTGNHIYFEAAHPTAELYKENAGFYWCRHFSIIRDVLPTIYNENIDPSIDLSGFFDKENAKKHIQKHYPLEADKLSNYIDNELILHARLNPEKYYKELKKFDLILSTNYKNE